MLGFFLFFILACLLLLAGILAFFIHLPDPGGWLLRPRWHGLGVLHCCALPVVGVVVVGFPMLLLGDLEGKSAGRIIVWVCIVMASLLWWAPTLLTFSQAEGTSSSSGSPLAP